MVGTVGLVSVTGGWVPIVGTVTGGAVGQDGHVELLGGSQNLTFLNSAIKHFGNTFVCSNLSIRQSDGTKRSLSLMFFNNLCSLFGAGLPQLYS